MAWMSLLSSHPGEDSEEEIQHSFTQALFHLFPVLTVGLWLKCKVCLGHFFWPLGWARARQDGEGSGSPHGLREDHEETSPTFFSSRSW